MREAIAMWQNTRMVVLTAISAAAYVAVLLPFKGLVLIPGLTEVRPAAAVPVVLSFLFGPAAAWGAGFGNVIADALGGMLGPGSLPGFVGNFLYGYLPYALWRNLMGTRHPTRSGVVGWLVLALAIVTSCLAIGTVIGWGVDLLGLAPFAALGLIIAVNNFVACVVLAVPLLSLLYSRTENWGLLHHQILEPTTAPLPAAGNAPSAPAPGAAPVAGTHPSLRTRVVALLCMGATVMAFATGLTISGTALQAGYGAAAFASQQAGHAALAVGMVPALAVLFLSALLL